MSKQNFFKFFVSEAFVQVLLGNVRSMKVPCWIRIKAEIYFFEVLPKSLPSGCIFFLQKYWRTHQLQLQLYIKMY